MMRIRLLRLLEALRYGVEGMEPGVEMVIGMG